MGTSNHFDESALETFREQVSGEVLQPSEEGYDEARTIWNAMIDKEPTVISRCTGTADIITSVNCDDGLVIDLSPMNAVRVDPDAKTARAEPG